MIRIIPHKGLVKRKYPRREEQAGAVISVNINLRKTYYSPALTLSELLDLRDKIDKYLFDYLLNGK